MNKKFVQASVINRWIGKYGRIIIIKKKWIYLKIAVNIKWLVYRIRNIYNAAISVRVEHINIVLTGSRINVSSFIYVPGNIVRKSNSVTIWRTVTGYRTVYPRKNCTIAIAKINSNLATVGRARCFAVSSNYNFVIVSAQKTVCDFPRAV